MPKSKKRRTRLPTRPCRRYLDLLRRLGDDGLSSQGNAVLADIVRGRQLVFAGPESPDDVLSRVSCVGRCRKLGSERAVAECVAGCMGLIALANRVRKGQG